MKEPKWEFYFSAELEKAPDGTYAPESEFYKDFTVMQKVDPDNGLADTLRLFANILRMLTYSESTIKECINMDNLL